MLKLSCIITGDDYQMVSKDTPTSKKKICLMAMCLFVPVLLWFINGYLLVTQVLSGSQWAGLLTGFITALLIFIIERSVIMSQGSRWIASFRIILGSLIALLGSIVLDEVIFKSDIDSQVFRNRNIFVQEELASLEEQSKAKIDSLQSDMDKKYGIWDKAHDEATKEADGSGGSGRRGVDGITRIKQQHADKMKIYYDQAMQQLSDENKKLDKAKTDLALGASNSFSEHSLLIRIKAMFDLIGDDSYMLIIYLLFTALLFFLEFLVVIIKMCYPETNYERKLKMIEDIGKDRMAKIMGKDSESYDGGKVQPQINRARAILSNTNTSIYSHASSPAY